MKKKFLFAILILLLPAFVWAWGTVIVSGNVSSGGTTYLIHETFDGSNACGDGSSTNCDETWVVNNSPVFNYTTAPAPLEGTYSWQADLTTETISIGFTPCDEVWVSAIVRDDVAVNYAKIFEVLDSTDNSLCWCEWYDTGAGVKLVARQTGGTNAPTDADYSADTTYYIKLRAKKGTGANAECQVSISTDGSTWTTPAASIDGTWTTEPSKIKLYGNDGTTTYGLKDDIRVDDADINY